jgi:phytoene dehydrogenase-like protein
VIVMLRTDYDYWQRIYGRRPYDIEQTEVSDQVIDFLDRIYPGLRADIEVVDEATPLSYERYTGQLAGQQHGLAADAADDDHEHLRHAEDTARSG